MATIEENLLEWNKLKHGGDVWSAPWGGADMEWNFVILPRIHHFVPAETILEIGPGTGRWTQFLAKLCKRLILVELCPKNIDFCKERFKGYSHITYHVNDGRSLGMVPDGAIDFAFSYGSLVHAEEDIVSEYLSQLAKKLKRNGAGFIGHSNAGAYKIYYNTYARLMYKILRGKARDIFAKLGLLELHYWRAYSMTWDKFKMCAENAGLKCVSQELINHGTTKRLIDCLSVIVRKDSNRPCEGKSIINKNFMKEARLIRNLSDLYGEKIWKWEA